MASAGANRAGPCPQPPAATFLRVRAWRIWSAAPATPGRAALVWCVASDDDPVCEIDETQRLALLASGMGAFT
ncbi:MAG: hypothetical protein U5L05_16490 [Rubrivivax sp.]|nr:hypothetical protein [Rubrivivax sp.]